jgi:glyoxylase-like metal-dependent hydrolase (beta-lactamase superfamily II)
MQVAIFTFNPFQENTYVLHDDTNSAIIIDPGCSTPAERQQLTDYISSNDLHVVKLVNTHCHIDHVLGNKYVAETYGLPLTSHQGEQQVLDMQPTVSGMYGMPYDAGPDITEFLEDGDTLDFGDTTLQVFYTPGHSPASISFYHAGTQQLIAGDVLFRESIGRTDLPGGSFEVLKASIEAKFWPLPEETIVYPGHGPSTTIGYERVNNPFLK